MSTEQVHGMQLESEGPWTLLRFAAARFRVVVDGRAVPHAPATALDLAPIDACINGPMFGFQSGNKYSTYTEGRLDYAHVDLEGGVSFPSRRTSAGATIYLDASRAAQCINGGIPPEGAVVALQGSPRLVREGREVHDDAQDPGHVWRPALVRFSSSELGFLVGRAVSMEELARRALELGAQDAVYLDGGGSTHLVVRGGGVIGAREQRRVPSWAAVARESALPALPGAIGVYPWPAVLAGSAVAVGLVLGIGAAISAARSQ